MLVLVARVEGIKPQAFLGAVLRSFATMPILAVAAVGVAFTLPPSAGHVMRLILTAASVALTHFALKSLQKWRKNRAIASVV